MAKKLALKTTTTKSAPKPAKAKITPAAPSAPAPPKIASTLQFYLDDFNKTLFPLKTNRVLIQNGENEIQAYILKCLDEGEASYNFPSQTKVYAAKQGMHVRRTVKLDVAAEFYLYDLVFRNRTLFRKPHTLDRTHYGYRFENGGPIPATAAYKGFKGALSEYGESYSHAMSMDVASYFNSVYHHDLVGWFAELGASEADYEGFGQLLRQINSGRSIDCLPQGMYPSKMIGNDFLRFIDNNFQIKSDKLVRFMDDIYLFSNDDKVISDDFQIIQKLLGAKGLSVNPQKTKHDEPEHAALDKKIENAKTDLLKRRRYAIVIGYDENDEEVVSEMMRKMPLSEAELEYISSILDAPHIEEEDAELILTIMRDHAHKVEGRLPYLISSFPNLAKSVYGFCASVDDKELIAAILIDVATQKRQLMEFQLFWFGAILEDYLMGTTKVAQLISVLFDHPSATQVTRAKILEIADKRFGLQEMRDDVLMSGESNWSSWAAAVGSRVLKRATRNHKLKYFGNVSNLNHLISTIVLKMP